MQSYKWLALGIMVAGITAIISGASNPSASWSIWLTSIGGAGVGATIGSFFIRLSSEDLIEYMKMILTETTSSKFTSNNEEIKHFKKKWYHYNVSQQDDIYKWRCSILDFSYDSSIGSLNTIAKYADKSGKIHQYKVEAGLRGERLLLFYYPPFGNESLGVEVIPFMGDSFEDVHSGYIVHQTWDGNHSLTPILISEKPLFKIRIEGDVAKEHNHSLNEIWLNGMKRINPIFKLPEVEKHNKALDDE